MYTNVAMSRLRNGLASALQESWDGDTDEFMATLQSLQKRVDLELAVIEDAYQALLSVGHSPVEARNRLDRVLTGGRAYTSVQEILGEIYKQQ